MTLDKTYSALRICPSTKHEIKDPSQYAGVCPHCGDNTGKMWLHDIIISGRWDRPNWFEYLCGSRKTFLSKEAEDATWERLKR